MVTGPIADKQTGYPTNGSSLSRAIVSAHATNHAVIFYLAFLDLFLPNLARHDYITYRYTAVKEHEYSRCILLYIMWALSSHSHENEPTS